eukprot:1136228-Pelagomonas_calceolata.AAC.7
MVRCHRGRHHAGGVTEWGRHHARDMLRTSFGWPSRRGAAKQEGSGRRGGIIKTCSAVGGCRTGDSDSHFPLAKATGECLLVESASRLADEVARRFRMLEAPAAVSLLAVGASGLKRSRYITEPSSKA